MKSDSEIDNRNICPKCRHSSFKVLGIFHDHYIRQCTDCGFPQLGEDSLNAIFYLPKLKKKIIYIDEFAIIELNRARLGTPREQFWSELYKLLLYLVDTQQIICPYSEFHVLESRASSIFDEIKRTYMILSHGINFKHREDILKIQFVQNISEWFKKGKQIQFQIESIFNGHIHGWNGNLTEHIETPERYLHNIDYKFDKENLHNKIGDIFKRWQGEPEIPIMDCFKEEWQSFGPTFINEFKKNITSYNMGLGSYCTEIVLSIIGYLRESKVEDRLLLETSEKYFNSELLKNIPFNRLQAGLFACLAHLAKTGQKQIDQSDIPTDFKIISYYLPYCDGILVDKKCHQLLDIIRDKKIYHYNTKVFSMRNRQDLMKYLNEIRIAISAPTKELLREVYSDTWQGSLLEL